MDSAINKIDAAVTQLLTLTKQLLSSLEHWAQGHASEEMVSDVYVKLGNEFNLVCRFFVDAGVDISDLGDVTVSLRQILEDALSKEACQATLDDCLPSIREIVVTLLRQLKHKQAVLRQHVPTVHQRAASNASTTSVNSSKSRRTPSSASTAAVTTAATVGTNAYQKSTTPTSAHVPIPPSQSPKRMPSERHNALSQLQKSQALERRASKRFSSYQIQKVINGADLTALPTSSTHTPVPTEYTDASVVEDRSEHARSTSRRPMLHPMEAVQETPQTEVDKVAVFFRLGTKVRKGMLPTPSSLPAIRLQFVDLFGYTPPSGDVFPDLTIQDHDTGVEYELSEATIKDIKHGSLLTLCAKTEQEDAIEAQIRTLVAAVQDLSTRVDTKLGVSAGKGTPVLGSGRFKPKEAATVAATTDKAASQTTPRLGSDSTDAFRQQLAVMRQLCSKTTASMRQEVSVINQQMVQLKTANSGTNRGYMTASYKKLSEDTQRLLNWVDDLQDIVEGQRKDVATRGVRLSQQQLDNTNREINRAHQELKELKQYIAKENPTWTKTWETELNTVVQEQQEFKLQTQIAEDLEADVQNTINTFELVERCALELSKTDVKRTHVAMAPAEDPAGARHEVLTEIVGLRPNHAARAEAIERAERLRKRELDMRSDEFKQELGNFVDGGRLKPSGGVEEAERRRRERDEITRDEQRKHEKDSPAQQAAQQAAKEERRRAREAARAGVDEMLLKEEQEEKERAAAAAAAAAAGGDPAIQDTQDTQDTQDS